MRNRPAPGSLRLAGVALAIVSSTCGCPPREVNTPRVDEGPAFAFVGVNVVPMDSERILPDQTVVVRAGVIAAIGPRTEIAVPPDVSSIDAGGTFLMPGLADMHVHTWDTDDFVL